MKDSLAKPTLNGPDDFPRFRVVGDGESLSQAKLTPQTELLLFERGGQERAFLVTQMIYHHVAQGELEGHPYLVTF